MLLLIGPKPSAQDSATEFIVLLRTVCARVSQLQVSISSSTSAHNGFFPRRERGRGYWDNCALSLSLSVCVCA